MNCSSIASSRSAYRPILIALALGLALTASGPACADDTPAPVDGKPTASSAQPAPETQAQEKNDWDTVMQLGSIQVQGDRDENAKRIVEGLKVIKHALKANLSNDPADANQVVCRMNYDTGSHLTAHLMCATNRSMMIYRDKLHTAIMTGSTGQADGAVTQTLEHMNGQVERSRYFSTSINAAELQKLLLQVQCAGCSNGGLVVGND